MRSKGLTGRFALAVSVAVITSALVLAWCTSPAAAANADYACPGNQSLEGLTTGLFDTACGYSALRENSTGSKNTASGADALSANTTGSYNTASGFTALFENTTGSYNTASGDEALFANTTGSYNTANGGDALYDNTTGSENTASGFDALLNNTTGSENVALGPLAGNKLTTGSSNIDIANEGVAGEADTIRIGSEGTQTKAFMAGIWDTHLTGCSVQVNEAGQLGCDQSAATEGPEGKQGPEGKISTKGVKICLPRKAAKAITTPPCPKKGYKEIKVAEL